MSLRASTLRFVWNAPLISNHIAYNSIGEKPIRSKQRECRHCLLFLHAPRAPPFRVLLFVVMVAS